jgi:hypothetical protein
LRRRLRADDGGATRAGATCPVPPRPCRRDLRRLCRPPHAEGRAANADDAAADAADRARPAPEIHGDHPPSANVPESGSRTVKLLIQDMPSMRRRRIAAQVSASSRDPAAAQNPGRRAAGRDSRPRVAAVAREVGSAAEIPSSSAGTTVVLHGSGTP